VVLALTTATVGNLAWFSSLGFLMYALLADRSKAWLPATVLGVLYGLGLYRGWAMQGLAAVYSPANLPELRGVRRWHLWASPVVALVQWFGLIASAFGDRVQWRSIDYQLGAAGRVISQRILAAQGANRREIPQHESTRLPLTPDT
jgi:hypothetical protein